MPPRIRPAVLSAILAACASAFSPSLAKAQNADEIQTLLSSSIQKFKASDQVQTRFTYQILEHQTNFSAKGKKVAEVTRLSEMLYLSGRPYVRLLAINGKPLAGKNLKAEQLRYEDAVKKGHGFTEKQRAEQNKGKYEEVNLHLATLLTDYDSRLKGKASIDGHDCLVIDAVPKPGPAGAKQRHATLWMDPSQKQIVKVAFDLLADEGDLKKGSSGWMLFQPMDGFIGMVASHIDYRIAFGSRGKHTVRIVTDSTMSNFQKFASTSTILPASTSAPPPLP